jgi:spore maturation protein CgeB
VDFVISNAFAPIVTETTHRLGIKYALYGMDSPMYMTYLPVYPRYDNCYLFYFDRREYEMAKAKGYQNVYYMPIAADVDMGEQLAITDEEIRKYSCDMSFVGSLYIKNDYDENLSSFPYEMQERFSEIIENAAFIWDGRNRLQIDDGLAEQIVERCPQVYEGRYELSKAYYLQSLFFARKLTNVERTLLMELLAERYDIHLYTREGENVPEGVRRFPEIGFKDSLKVFYSSKINLNITLRSIETGLPARIMDIMSVGGFVLTNWQEEIPELFEEDKEIVTFKTPEELIEKADYYLTHEKERLRIGYAGYRKVKKEYTYEHLIGKIISVMYPGK